MADLIREISLQPVKLTIEESSAVVDGKAVLGKLRGEFFVPNGISRNKRFYGSEVWEGQLKNEDIQSKLKDYRMFGTIGHNIKVNDESLAEGKLSHITTYLGMENADGDKVKGVGEALILNTEAGRNLNTVLRAGSKLYVSSRANGDYKGTSHGVPSVDPNTFKLEGFDFVMEPGFLQANPALVESLHIKPEEIKKLAEDLNESVAVNSPEGVTINVASGGIVNIGSKEKPTLEGKPSIPNKIEERNQEDIHMDEKLIESLMTEKRTLSESLSTATKDLETMKQEKVVMGSEISKLREDLKAKEKEVGDKVPLLEGYSKLGSPSDVEKALDLAEKVIWKYKESGSPDEVREALEKAFTEIQSYRQMGTVADINEAFDKAESLIKKYRELGTLTELSEALDTATVIFGRFQELGSPAEISLALDKASKLAEGIREDRFGKRVERLSAELGVPAQAIKEVATKMNDVEVRKFVKALTESKKLSTKYLKPKPGALPGKKEDLKSKPAIFQKTSGQNLLERFNRVTTNSFPTREK